MYIIPSCYALDTVGGEQHMDTLQGLHVYFLLAKWGSG